MPYLLFIPGDAYAQRSIEFHENPERAGTAAEATKQGGTQKSASPGMFSNAGSRPVITEFGSRTSKSYYPAAMPARYPE